MKKALNFETLQLHAGQEAPDPATGARAVPIYQTSSFVFDNCDHASSLFDLTGEGFIYSRINNPTTDVFEKRMTAIEGGVGALGLASGAAAVSYSLLNILSKGDRLISSRNIYGGTYNLFAHTFSDYGIETDFVDPGDLSAFKKAVKPSTKAVFIESFGNPNSDIPDIERIAAIAHNEGIPLIIDNTFATPFLLRPAEHGADIIVHSATKFIGGHGTTIGGVVVDAGNFDWAASGKFPCLTQPNSSYHGISFTGKMGREAYIVKMRVTLLRDTGASMAPFNAFLLLQGLETLSLRVERHVSNALAVAAFLASHPKVKKVNHPSLPGNTSNRLYKKYFPKGGGSIFTFEIKGGASKARAFVDKLKIFSHLANVADVKSLVIHPASTTHSQMNSAELEASGIKPESIRLSVGTEHIDDLINDLDQALS